jgi:hypothetical protein
MSNQEEHGFILVTMVGKIVDSTLNFTKNANPYTKGKIAIPFTTREDELKHKFYNFIVWSELAELVAEIPVDTTVKMEGDLRTSSYMAKCKDCNTEYRAYWTDVVVNSVDLV